VADIEMRWKKTNTTFLIFKEHANYGRTIWSVPSHNRKNMNTVLRVQQDIYDMYPRSYNMIRGSPEYGHTIQFCKSQKYARFEAKVYVIRWRARVFEGRNGVDKFTLKIISAQPVYDDMLKYFEL
jgi:hypothetical protein